MNLTQRHLQPEQVAGVFRALGVYDTLVDGYIRAVYTRQPEGNWTYFMGQCVLGQEAQPDHAEVYRTFAFIGKRLSQVAVKALLEMLGNVGIDVGSGLPPIRLPTALSNWNEELVPCHTLTRSRTPMRRLMVTVEPNAFFPDTQLMDYTLPYRPSAARYVKEFLGLAAFHDTNDGRRGQFSVEVPDTRGAIRFAGGLISINNPTVPLRLVGTINGDIPVDVRSNSTADYDEKTVSQVELWLLTEENEFVDYVSTSSWSYTFAAAPQQAKEEERLLALVQGGESEICEFKPHVDIASQKASEIGKTVCAFSNRHGGTLFIGVNDDGDIIGLAADLTKRPDDLEKALTEYERRIAKSLREALRDGQCYNSRVATVSGTQLIVIDVQRSAEINYFVKSDLAHMAFIRRGATNARMSPAEILAKGGGDGNADSILRNRVFGS